METPSVNRNALAIVTTMMERAGELGILVSKTSNGATVIDAGFDMKGGYMAGRLITEICLGGLGSTSLIPVSIGDLHLPGVFVATDHPAISLLGSQAAGWRISVSTYTAMGSGPARALALKPKKTYSSIGYKDEAEAAIIFLEADETPGEDVANYISKACGVAPSSLYILTAPTSSLVGSVQVSGRVVEVGLHKLVANGLEATKVLHGCGRAPIAPVHPDKAESMGRTNDMIIYGGVVQFTVQFDDDAKLKEMVERAPSSESKAYGRRFIEVFEEADGDFYKIDPKLFAPAVVVVNNAKTGKTFASGVVDLPLLKRSVFG